MGRLGPVPGKDLFRKPAGLAVTEYNSSWGIWVCTRLLCIISRLRGKKTG